VLLTHAGTQLAHAVAATGFLLLSQAVQLIG
jgi:hypothetical protein